MPRGSVSSAPIILNPNASPILNTGVPLILSLSKDASLIISGLRAVRLRPGQG